MATRQTMTREWWDQSKVKYDIFVSEAVIDECAAYKDEEMVIKQK